MEQSYFYEIFSFVEDILEKNSYIIRGDCRFFFVINNLTDMNE